MENIPILLACDDDGNQIFRNTKELKIYEKLQKPLTPDSFHHCFARLQTIKEQKQRILIIEDVQIQAQLLKMFINRHFNYIVDIKHDIFNEQELRDYLEKH